MLTHFISLYLGNYITSLDFSPNGETVATIDKDGVCLVSDMNTDSYRFHLNMEIQNYWGEGRQIFKIYNFPASFFFYYNQNYSSHFCYNLWQNLKILFFLWLLVRWLGTLPMEQQSWWATIICQVWSQTPQYPRYWEESFRFEGSDSNRLNR